MATTAAWDKVAPPRQRGWTRRIEGGLVGGAGSPAPAGMDRTDDPVISLFAGLPRASGDGPLRMTSRNVPTAAPPRQRGWTAPAPRPASPCLGSPAPAGMDPPTHRRTPRLRRLPRASGDGPYPGDNSTTAPEAPPRQRGWTRGCAGRGDGLDGSPAPAGMDRPPRVAGRGHPRLPRASGDGPSQGREVRDLEQAPPRQRGWTPGDRGDRRSRRGSPAPAGMDRSRAIRSSSWRRLPRASGDGPGDGGSGGGLGLAPPRQRGWTVHA